MRSDSVQYGEDKALIMVQDGSGGTMMAHGIGRHVGADKISFRGLAIIGPANTGKLATLNSLLVVFEAEVDGDNLSIKGWGWKYG